MKKYPKKEVDPKTINYTKYKIIVPTKEDYEELKEAFKYFHYSDVDSSYIIVNQLIHEYLDIDEGDEYKNNIIINEKLYNAIK
jgi:Fe-S-cluster formation regulator IscX/YfhJ